jgi:hypothetical protein
MTEADITTTMAPFGKGMANVLITFDDGAGGQLAMNMCL